MIKFISNAKGFTLIEIVISLGILMIGILAVLALFPVGFDSASRSADLTKATIFAQDRMEEIKRLGYPVAAVPSATAFSDPRFSYMVTVSTAGLPANCQQVTLTVSWNYKQRTLNENFVTIIASLGP
ncbi:MAG: prepilin-type N-terminal cleavage/methylation domain-containing protein [Candidatus Omnitrophica bacterium]|nr:prepilin-type N-terminal cleavage/methylation domain-containing protein [Candidatus Omnitrophota bacterium]